MEQIESTMPLVTVIIPVYNAEQTICETLDSVFDQRYKHLQVIVVDDGSTDNSVEKIQSYCDARLELIRLSENANLIAARNCALERARGDYIAFLDSDDIWLPTKIEKQVKLLENEPSIGACFTWGEIIDENSNTHTLENSEVRWFYDAFHEKNRSHKEWLLRLLTGSNFLLCSSSFIRSEIVQKVGKQNLTLLQLQDYEYWIRILSHCNIHIICEELTKYRRVITGNSLSASNPINQIRSMNEGVYICKHFFDFISNELFISLFQDNFRNADSKTDVELACEKAFLIEKAYCGKEPFYSCLEDLISNETSADVLAKRFGYTHKDFYRDNAGHRYISPLEYQKRSETIRQLSESVDQHLETIRQLSESMAQNLETIDQYAKKIDSLNQHNSELLEHIHFMTISRSWRITKPLRAVAEKIRTMLR